MVSVDAALDWADTGLAYLTGESDGQPDFSRAAVLAEARRVAADIARLLGVEVEAATMLAGRAAILGLTRRGRVSAGGATRLLDTADGWCAIALPRADDIATLPALLEADKVPGDPWMALSGWAATVDRAGCPRHCRITAVAGLGKCARAADGATVSQPCRAAAGGRIAGGRRRRCGRTVVRAAVAARGVVVGWKARAARRHP
jgi:hypothetical protein